MIIRRYRAKDMNEAIRRIRRELGENAIIVSQKRVRKKGFLGIFHKKIVEVTAAVDNSQRKQEYSYEDKTRSVEALKEAVRNKKKISDVKNNKENNLASEVHKMRIMLNNMVENSNGTIGKSKFQLKLENSDLNKNVIKKIMRNMEYMDENLEENQKLKSVISRMIKVEDKSLEKIVVLVGPTGVGKTTTIAKLAGRMSLIEKKSVGLITIDTYRIGAVEQLRTYADIMNIPFKVVISIKDMEKAVESMNKCDVILVDTTGRSSKNKMQISELRAYIDKLNTHNVHLVISCTTKNSDINVIVNGYKELNYSNIIITKLDETSTYGSVLNIIEAAKKPISFVTTGQNVPEDIKFMNSDELARLVTGEDIIC